MSTHPYRLEYSLDHFTIDGVFRIARGSKAHAEVLTLRLGAGEVSGWGEAVPYGRYGESGSSVTLQIDNIKQEIESGISLDELQALLPAGAARNALDVALWDLYCKQRARSITSLLGMTDLEPQTTAYSLSLQSPARMLEAAEKAAGYGLLKVKLGAGDGQDAKRIASVRRGAPGARLIVDANEGWRQENFAENVRACANVGVEMIEQPLPAGEDGRLKALDRPVPLCADESFHTLSDIPTIRGCYDAVNIKLDKTGGLTAALAAKKAALEEGLHIMAGCMVGTSLAMAPAMVVAQGADFVDLDGPLLLKEDRDCPLVFDGDVIYPPGKALWG